MEGWIYAAKIVRSAITLLNEFGYGATMRARLRVT